MRQQLILPINKMEVTVGYKHPWYNRTQKRTHHGVDAVHANGKTHLYACGNGVVTHKGKDNVLGNVVAIKYPNVYCADGVTRNLVVRYFHLAKITCTVGQQVNTDSLIGYYGNTGKYSNGAHLHLEVDTDYDYPQYTPELSKSSNIFKASPTGYPDTTINPTKVFFIKNAAPEWQSVKGKAIYGGVNGSWSPEDTHYKMM